ncbi:unnamed protein product, partial [Adineta steineri]
MHSSTIIASIIVLVTIAAKHSSIATHDSYSQALRRRTNAYNYDKNQQRNMFLRRLAQQLIEDEDSDESLRSAAWKRDNSVSNDGTILGIAEGGDLWTRANLTSDWAKLPNSNGAFFGGVHSNIGAVKGVTQLNDGTILGIAEGGDLWTRANLASDWVKLPNSNGAFYGGVHSNTGAVIGVTQLNDGTILGIAAGGDLWTRANLASDWVKLPNSNGAFFGGVHSNIGAVIGVTQLNYPKIP